MEAYVIDLTSDCEEYTAALRKLEFGIATARSEGRVFVKVIHGDIESGAAARIRREARAFLRSYHKAGKITFVIPGEKFASSARETLYLINKCHGAENDIDIDAENRSISIVLI